MPHGMRDGLGIRYQDLSGKRFGRLLAVKDGGRDASKNTIWICRCDCGTETRVSSASLKKGHTSSCGCLQREKRGSGRFVDLAGKKFGRLIVLAKAGYSPHKKILWKVICDCGVEKEIIGASLTGGRTLSCGCHSREMSAKTGVTHGMSNSPEYRTWTSMIARCIYPTATGFENYGGRGIKVCERWRESFEAFFADMGFRPSSEHSIDRYPNVDGNYEPGNVRWATQTDQARNKRDTIILTMGGHTKTLREWSEITGIPVTTIRDRVRKFGWQVEEALGFKERVA